VVAFDGPKSWGLTFKDDIDCEATVHLQGILCAFKLPPIQARYGSQTLPSIITNEANIKSAKDYGMEAPLHKTRCYTYQSVNRNFHKGSREMQYYVFRHESPISRRKDCPLAMQDI